ncbi:MAG: FMN-binding protein [Methylococcaceae bacterium]|nr:FMN-binding protein [Methylococcaceae bacterium]
MKISGNRMLMSIVLLLAVSVPVTATIFFSKNEAMVLAFGEAAKVETLSLFPDEQQKQTIEKEAKVKLDSGMFSFYVGKQEDKIVGYASIETITVRTKPETLMIVLTPEGSVRNVYTLAFHEPPEYQPPENWFNQLIGKPLEEMDFSKGIQGVAGATLSTRAAVSSTRKVVSIFRTMLKNQGQP